MNYRIESRFQFCRAPEPDVVRPSPASIITAALLRARGYRVDRDHRCSHSREHARLRRIEDDPSHTVSVRPAWTTWPTAISRSVLAGFKKWILNSTVNTLSIGRHDRQRCGATGDVDETGHDAAVKQPMLLRQPIVEPTGDRHAVTKRFRVR